MDGLQVVHWDRQSPGIQHDRADRLVDLYASGEQRSYGPLFLQRKMNISNQAFTEGDFSLTISDLQVGGTTEPKYTTLAGVARPCEGLLPLNVSPCTLWIVFITAYVKFISVQSPE